MKRISFLFIALSFVATLMAQSSHKTQNVILVTIDGFRWQEMFNGADSSFINNKQLVEDAANCGKKYWDNSVDARRKMLLPFIWDTIASKGQIYGNRTKGCNVNVKNTYWFSYPGYNEILTGYADSRVNSNSFGPNPNISLFEVMNKTPKYAGRIAAFASWDAFNDILNEKRSGLIVSAGFDKVNGMDSDSKMNLLNSMQTQLPDIFHGVRLDGVTFNMGFEYLKTKRPRILYLSFDETDDFAHGGRYEDYLNSAHYTDDFLRTLWNWIQSDPEYKDKTTLLITCDHGRGEGPIGWRSHGTETANSNQTWFAVMGPDTPALGEMTSGQYYNNQFAKTMAALLGFNFETPNPVGDPIVSVLGK
ncbi:sulfatase-like hydrolase/transferase [uncultured Bacteroides sp.]|uniref:sulfatase-like hydrolase/transferase n=1 Tax=uncultured Bacteroides sp. TaxID=162156 RepID=UPI002AA820AC|nr:sulfatase-like hydrolase/transferase [uncultured Bacteroides sp.]